MNANEEFLEENGEDVVSIDPPSAESASIGGESTAPDRTILGDLNNLAHLTFGTRWSPNESAPQRSFDRQRSFPKRRFSQGRDRNSNRSEHGQWEHSGSGEHAYSDSNEHRREGGYPSQGRRPFSSRDRFDRRREYRVFIPPFEVQFYQEDQSFNLLLEEMRKNCKTYELFTVARLILQKPERFVVTVRRKPNVNGVVESLYLSLLDDLIFDSEHEMMAYIIQHHVEEFFDVVEETVEAPKGRFTCVHRCGLTKKLLSAPNYHKYKTILRDHFNSEIHSMPFEHFVTKIETTKEESDIQAWLQQMSQKITYTPKVIDESVIDLAPIDSLEGVKNYLLKYFKERIMREVMTIRIAGIHCESIPSKIMGRAIQFFLQQQRRFPFDTANNLRNRFRRAGFGIYRKGKQGISYICASRRKFRSETDVFESNIQALILFLEPLEKINLETIKKDYIEAQSLPEKEVFDSLNWLIREGYVVEYENGELFLNPKLMATKKMDKVGDGEAASGENSVISLSMIETSIEKFSDGTLTIASETTLAVPDSDTLSELGVLAADNGISPAKNTMKEKKNLNSDMAIQEKEIKNVEPDGGENLSLNL